MFHVKRKLDFNRVPVVDRIPQILYERLKRYVSLLDKWRGVTNLISDHAFQEVWSRHIEDSLRVQRIAPLAQRWLDLGAGAGFPGVIVGSILAGSPSARVICVDSDSRKCAFLRQVAVELEIPLQVHNSRIEMLSANDLGPIDVITAKAFASIERILDLTGPYLSGGALAVLPRGKSYPLEIERLDLSRYTVSIASKPEYGDGAIVAIREKPRAR